LLGSQGALRKSGIIGQTAAGYALVSFGVAVIVGLLGLVILLRLFKEAAATGRGLDGLATANLALILFGFCVVMGGAVGGAFLAWVGVLIVPVLGVFLVFLGRYRSSLALPPPTQKPGGTPEGSEARSVSGGGQRVPEPRPWWRRWLGG
jgi:hypothetical protein